MSTGSQGKNGNRNRPRKPPTHPGLAGRTKVRRKGRHRRQDDPEQESHLEELMADRLMARLRLFERAKRRTQHGGRRER